MRKFQFCVKNLNMHNYRIQLFSSIKDRLGKREINVDIDAPEISVAHLIEEISKNYPSISKDLTFCRVAINQEYKRKEELLKKDDEIAIIPPVSGG
ncbi:MoaD/ThiS family protein [Candidatus Riflebacteria bacterium]